jgi:hypothetical protein
MKANLSLKDPKVGRLPAAKGSRRMTAGAIVEKAPVKAGGTIPSKEDQVASEAAILVEDDSDEELYRDSTPVVRPGSDKAVSRSSRT